MDLSDWLLCDRWNREEATLLLAGINPTGTTYSGKSTLETGQIFPGPIACLDGETLRIPVLPIPMICDEQTIKWLTGISEEHEKIKEKRNLLASRVYRISNLISRSAIQENASPKEFVEWAISKGIDVPEPLAQRFQADLTKGHETPEDRRKRLIDRVLTEKGKGNRSFLKAVADEERISVSRLKQLIKTESPASDNRIVRLLSPSSQSGLKRPKAKK